MAVHSIGDIVQLKSGGPKMTVVEIAANGKLWCAWFAGAKSEKGLFPIEALQIPLKEESKTK